MTTLDAFRVQVGRNTISQLGGPKAGHRQAAGLFAFLLDRGDRGIRKDEIIDLIWPDAPMESADLAFHRTLGGLRRTLVPDLRPDPIVLYNGRYRLDGAIIAWCDADAFQDLVIRAARSQEPTEPIALLEQAVAMYRADYMDDCPFYGDSVHVEPRRSLLRAQLADALAELSRRYGEAGEELLALQFLRDAAAVHDLEGLQPISAWRKPVLAASSP